MAEEVPAYTKLAQIYDEIMSDVDYESWADFIDEIIQTHHHRPLDVLELACGTGSVSLFLDELGCYKVTASDGSNQMVEIAKEKIEKQNADIDIYQLDFLNLKFHKTFDIVFSVFDSVNYLKQYNDIKYFLNESVKLLNYNGLLIFDFTTPRNSFEAVEFLNNEEGSSGNIRFYRQSRFEPGEKIHYNIFDIEELDTESGEVISRSRESHEQRIYTLKEMLSIVQQSPYHLVAKYNGFDLIDADENSARITMVLRCQKAQ